MREQIYQTIIEWFKVQSEEPACNFVREENPTEVVLEGTFNLSQLAGEVVNIIVAEIAKARGE